jgi:hypothetical protein
MSRKTNAPSRQRRALPRTDKDALKKLPQFRPGPSFDIDHINIQTGSLSAFPPERLKEIRNVLTEHIQSHVRVVEWSGEPTGLERFLREAVKAIGSSITSSARASRVVWSPQRSVKQSSCALIKLRLAGFFIPCTRRRLGLARVPSQEGAIRQRLIAHS